MLFAACSLVGAAHNHPKGFILEKPSTRQAYQLTKCEVRRPNGRGNPTTAPRTQLAIHSRAGRLSPCRCRGREQSFVRHVPSFDFCATVFIKERYRHR